MIRYMIAIIGMLLGANLAAAAIVVDSFSCNGQTTTISVENGEPMNCNAILLNSDTQNGVSVNQVSLVVSGGWAEKDSYTVSLNTNIGAGQSTTVTFQNIRSTTPGDDHRFLHIDIDSTAHTESVDSASVNAVALKSLTAASTASSATAGQSFTVSSTVTTGGSYSGVTLSISPSGCSLDSGESAAKSIGAMGNNAQATRSWSLAQGSGSCSITVTATGTSSPVVSAKSKSLTVSNPSAGSATTSSSSSSSGGGGGGGGGGNATSNKTAAAQESQPSGQQAGGQTAQPPESQPGAAQPETVGEQPFAVGAEQTYQASYLTIAAAAIALAAFAFWARRAKAGKQQKARKQSVKEK